MVGLLLEIQWKRNFSVLLSVIWTNRIIGLFIVKKEMHEVPITWCVNALQMTASTKARWTTTMTSAVMKNLTAEEPTRMYVEFHSLIKQTWLKCNPNLRKEKHPLSQFVLSNSWSDSCYLHSWRFYEYVRKLRNHRNKMVILLIIFNRRWDWLHPATYK